MKKLNPVLLQKKFFVPAVALIKGEFAGMQKDAQQYLLERIKKKEAFAIIEKNQLLGVICFVKNLCSHNPADYIDFVVVSKESRGKGIARTLIEKIIETSKKAHKEKFAYLWSSTDLKNSVSKKMHKKLGFKTMGIIKKLHYGEDEIFFGYKLH